MADEKYFNFPIQLLQGFMVDHEKALNNILLYSLYAHSLKLEYGNELECFKSSLDYYSVEFGNPLSAYNKAVKIYEQVDSNGPKAGINKKVFWDFRDSHKTAFEKGVLLAFLALKSIVQMKPYCKVDNKFMLARMDGKAKACELTELSKEISQFANEYQTKKLKAALVDGWGLITYSRYTRGFYVSFKLSLDDLVYEAEKRRQSYKDKQRKQEINDALEKAKARLAATRP